METIEVVLLRPVGPGNLEILDLGSKSLARLVVCFA